MDLAPAEAVYVGDDWDKDVLAARNAGMRPVWIQHHSVKRSWPEIKEPEVPLITSLEPLLELEELVPCFLPNKGHLYY